jgi:hypothetical protein
MPYTTLGGKESQANFRIVTLSDSSSSSGGSVPSSEPPSPKTQHGASLHLWQLRIIMGFSNDAELMSFIRSDAVQIPFDEFVDDFLGNDSDFQQPSFANVMAQIGMNHVTYSADHPDKQGWWVEDHFGRFIVQTYSMAQRADITWRGVEEEDMAVIGSHRFELLLYMARRWIDDTEI